MKHYALHFVGVTEGIEAIGLSIGREELEELVRYLSGAKKCDSFRIVQLSEERRGGEVFNSLLPPKGLFATDFPVDNTK